MAPVEVTTTDYAGWTDCVRVSNGQIELVAPTAVGPRVVHCGPIDGANLLYEGEHLGATDRDEWTMYGGHRLWHAPESVPRTYEPDNDPLAVEREHRGMTLTAPTEETTGVRKAIDISMAPDRPVVELTHRLTNDGLWPIEFAPWAVTVCAAGGRAVLPMAGGDPEDDLPDRSVVYWPYTDASDDRFTRVDDHLLVDQAPGEDCKVGVTGTDGWGAYVRDGTAFVKSIDPDPTATYPDAGSVFEVYVADDLLELETLGPLATVDPGETVSHTETWSIETGVATPDDAASARALAPE
ncbi:hypothetical protein [Halococcoides cellulosivorans]|uniref:DUF4380 domain-containing protein n=1 Tax=Halococcoides cellulosivorans TaxID=1679096 RepID=A0A2R4WYP2_9EURY|nr:hypothetical protein [Halococcoides cellulosivorans]AWB26660.1 hypothetical protein HARCEL1_02500 [Halococcoides cellulosivorans]